MKGKSIPLLAVSAAVMLMGLSILFSGDSIVIAALFIIIGIAIFFLAKFLRGADVQNTQYREYRGNSIGTPATVKSFRIAGVRFDNADGSSRQDVLERIYREEEPFKELSVLLDQYYYRGKPALAVKINGYEVGSIKEKDLPYIAAHLNDLQSVKDFKVEPFTDDDGELVYAAILKLAFTKR